MVAPKLQLRSIAIGDDPEAWAAAGFEVLDGRVRLGDTALDLRGGDRPGFLGWSFDGLDPQDLPHGVDGLTLVEADRTATAASATHPMAHPNGIGRLDHVALMTGNVERAVDAFAAAGFELRRQRDAVTFGRPVRQSFFWAGDVILELVGPAPGERSTDDATAVFGLALVAQDLDATCELLGDLISAPRPAVQPGRRIATLRGEPLGISLPVAVMSPHV